MVDMYSSLGSPHMITFSRMYPPSTYFIDDIYHVCSL
jgi:hypothetical protein